MKKPGLSIRYKILILLTMLPVVTLALYLVLAVRIFESDKVAYVFESSSAVAKTLSNQTYTNLSSVLISAKPIIQEHLMEQRFGSVSQALIESSDSLEWVAAFKKNAQTGLYEQNGVIEREQGVGARELQSFGDMRTLFAEAQSVPRLVRVPFKDDRVLIVERVLGSSAQDETSFYLMMCRLTDLANSFRAPGASELFLINKQGYVLFGPSEDEGQYLSQKLSSEFLNKLQELKYATGTEEVQSQEGATLLASYAKSNFADISVLSLVRKDEALKAVQILLRRSMIFFVLLISVTTLVSLFASGAVTSKLVSLYEATKRVAEGFFDVKVKVTSHDEIGSLAESFNVMASEVSRLMQETAEKARMESELQTAKTVQETLFPAAEAQFGNLMIAGHYEPASECGGDWWHYCKVGTKIFLWIGDATGHGAPAALITSAAKSASTIIERLNVDPAHAMELLNRAIYDVSKGRIMMTFFLASYDTQSHQLTYSNASHEAPFLMKKKDGPLKKKDLIPLNEVNNPRLGQKRDHTYQQVTIQLDPGDRLFFYTDGLMDVHNKNKEAWGERNFIKALLDVTANSQNVNYSAKEFTAKINEYREGTSLIDDITFFMCERS